MIGISGVPYDTPDFELDAMIEAVAGRALPKLQAELSRRIAGAKPEIKPEEPRRPSLAALVAPDSNACKECGLVGEKCDECAEPAPVEEPAKVGEIEVAPVEPVEIPKAADVELPAVDIGQTANAWGVEISLPRLEHFATDLSDEQVKGVNTVLSEAGFKGDDRHPAALALIQELLTGVPGLEALVRQSLTSIKDLSKGEAMLVMDWFDAVRRENWDILDELHAAAQGIKGAIRREAGQKELFVEAAPEPVRPIDRMIDALAADLIPAAFAELAPKLAPEPEPALEPEPDDEKLSAKPVQITACEDAPLPPVRPASLVGERPDIFNPFGPELSEEQADAVGIVMQAAEEGGRVVFLTGNAGTGKSVVTRAIQGNTNCLLCATTGIAGRNIGAPTIHSLFELGARMPDPARVGGVRNETKQLAIKAARVIAIDEVSMCNSVMIDALDMCLRKTTLVDEPFGGKTLVLIGDMLQLPPVVTDKEKSAFDGYASEFWFDAKVFQGDERNLLGSKTAEIERVNLTKIFRQTDEDFTNALNLIRIGDPRGVSFLNGCRKGENKAADGPAPVIITYTNDAAAEINEARLAELCGDVHVFEADITGDWKGEESPVADRIELKTGARVMIRRNFQELYSNLKVVNGDTGVVVDFDNGNPVVMLDRSGRPSVVITPQIWENEGYAADENGKVIKTVLGRFTQVPLSLGWAITAHKSQGMTLDRVLLAGDGTRRQSGQVYVALSRVKSLEGLFMRKPIDKSEIVVHPRVRKFEEGYSITPAKRPVLGGVA